MFTTNGIRIFCVLLVVESVVCENNETEFADGEIIAGIPFMEYEAFCPDDAPVRLFQYKLLTVRNERDSLLFNVSEWPSQDVVLRALCFNFTDFFGDEWVNVSGAECRFGEAFEAGRTVWDNDPTYMCKDGEYVNGVSSEYINGSRWLKVRCCKMDEFQRLEPMCIDVPPDPKYNDFLLKQRKNCTIDILTAATVSRGGDYRVVGKYCGYERKDFMPDPYCAAKRRVGLKRTLAKLGPPREEEAQNAEAIANNIEQGNSTTPGEVFDFMCPEFEAINRIDAKMADGDFAFAFYCGNVTDEPQISQWVRYTDYQPLPETDEVSFGCEYQQDEVMCGVKSYMSPRAEARMYSFACCGMSNAEVLDVQDEEIRRVSFISVNGDNPVASTRAKGKQRRFLHRFHVEHQDAHNGSAMATAWSTYEFISQPRSSPLLQISSSTRAQWSVNCVTTLLLSIIACVKSCE